jgi:hypothetical protein
MESDWEVELDSDAPTIDALWAGFVDLRLTPERISEIHEAIQFRELTNALLKINRQGMLWTAKCDVWETRNCDPDEMEAPAEEATVGIACYIDLLPCSEMVFLDLPQAETWVREVVDLLRLEYRRCARVDLVIRRAIVGDIVGLGATAYIVGCGHDTESAGEALQAALEVLPQALSAPSDVHHTVEN